MKVNVINFEATKVDVLEHREPPDLLNNFRASLYRLAEIEPAFTCQNLEDVWYRLR